MKKLRTPIIEWSHEDKCFVGHCEEFSSVMVHGDSPNEAYEELTKVLDMIEELDEDKNFSHMYNWMSANKETHLVFKLEDLGCYLTEDLKEDLIRIVRRIGYMRSVNGKKQNKYLVVNRDEPYADQVESLIGLNEEI